MHTTKECSSAPHSRSSSSPNPNTLFRVIDPNYTRGTCGSEFGFVPVDRPTSAPYSSSSYHTSAPRRTSNFGAGIFSCAHKLAEESLPRSLCPLCMQCGRAWIAFRQCAREDLIRKEPCPAKVENDFYDADDGQVATTVVFAEEEPAIARPAHSVGLTVHIVRVVWTEGLAEALCVGDLDDEQLGEVQSRGHSV